MVRAAGHDGGNLGRPPGEAGETSDQAMRFTYLT